MEPFKLDGFNWEPTERSALDPRQKRTLKKKGVFIREKADGTFKVYRRTTDGYRAVNVGPDKIQDVKKTLEKMGYRS